MEQKEKMLAAAARKAQDIKHITPVKGLSSAAEYEHASEQIIAVNTGLITVVAVESEKGLATKTELTQQSSVHDKKLHSTLALPTSCDDPSSLQKQGSKARTTPCSIMASTTSKSTELPVVLPCDILARSTNNASIDDAWDGNEPLDMPRHNHILPAIYPTPSDARGSYSVCSSKPPFLQSFANTDTSFSFKPPIIAFFQEEQLITTIICSPPKVDS
jgi:hypothetical protein